MLVLISMKGVNVRSSYQIVRLYILLFAEQDPVDSHNLVVSLNRFKLSGALPITSILIHPFFFIIIKVVGIKSNNRVHYLYKFSFPPYDLDDCQYLIYFQMFRR